MKTYTCSDLRRHLSEVLDTARREEVLIRRRGGETFRLIYDVPRKSPFDVPAVKTKATTRDILAAIRKSRSASR
ncbi:MAG TPA: type II toxin-antitoxin system prevent-host-death family antitoxin [Candidatus Bathyarchaeia archaeon]|nr:type II toxin-antitoxin system prevent-host-death family antitoxin [Candidatus Bathyarchaeia archaeon]